MAITYTNVIYDNVIDALNTLISDEFSVPVRYDEHTGNQSFLITPTSDSLIDHTTVTQVREYSLEIAYQLKSGGRYTRNNFKRVSEVSERLKRLIHNNTANGSGATYKWQDGNVSEVEYARDEGDPSVLGSLTTFNCVVQESY